jgi:hypothetical protein
VARSGRRAAGRSDHSPHRGSSDPNTTKRAQQMSGMVGGFTYRRKALTRLTHWRNSKLSLTTHPIISSALLQTAVSDPLLRIRAWWTLNCILHRTSFSTGIGCNLEEPL